MPIILRCQCGKETFHVYPANESWLIEPQIGGTKVSCPECRQKETAETASNNEILTQLINFFKRPPTPADLAEYGKKLLIFFRKEQIKHGRKGCLCVECQGDMVNALKELAGQKETAITSNDKPVVFITRPITPANTLRPSESPDEENDVA